MSADHRRFLELFLANQHDIRAFVASAVRDWHIVDDLMQELALILWDKYDVYDPSRPFGAWARGIAANLVKRAHRQMGNKRLVLLSPEALNAVREGFDDVEKTDGDDLQLEHLRRCMEHLSDRAQNLVRLRYGDGLDLPGVAEHSGSSYAAVKKALTRIRASLSDCIQRRVQQEPSA